MRDPEYTRHQLCLHASSLLVGVRPRVAQSSRDISSSVSVNTTRCVVFLTYNYTSNRAAVDVYIVSSMVGGSITGMVGVQVEKRTDLAAF